MPEGLGNWYAQALMKRKRLGIIVKTIPGHLALQAFVRNWRPQLDTIKPRVPRWSLDVDPLVF